MKFTNALLACAAAAVAVGVNAIDCQQSGSGYQDTLTTYDPCLAAALSSENKRCDCADDWKGDLNNIDVCDVTAAVSEDVDQAIADCAPLRALQKALSSGASSNAPLSFAAAIAVVVGCVSVN